MIACIWWNVSHTLQQPPLPSGARGFSASICLARAPVAAITRSNSSHQSHRHHASSGRREEHMNGRREENRGRLPGGAEGHHIFAVSSYVEPRWDAILLIFLPLLSSTSHSFSYLWGTNWRTWQQFTYIYQSHRLQLHVYLYLSHLGIIRVTRS
jgi:hypothetical protein